MAETPDADDSAPWYYVEVVGVSGVTRYGRIVEEEAAREGVDPEFVKAIMFSEYSRGHYFGAAWPAQRRSGSSLFPMNIKPSIWGELTPEDPTLEDPRINIRAAVRLIKGLQDRIVDPTPAKVASLYNVTAADEVRDFGAFVARVLREKPWKIAPTGQMKRAFDK